LSEAEARSGSRLTIKDSFSGVFLRKSDMRKTAPG
jgi:hypothetical protein